MLSLLIVCCLTVAIPGSLAQKSKSNLSNIIDCATDGTAYRVKGAVRREEIITIQLNFTMTEDGGNENYLQILIEKIMGENRKKLLVLKHPGVCAALSTYGGTTYAEIGAQIQPPIDTKKCPIPQNTYVLDWYALDENKLPVLRLVPKGHFFVQIEAFRSPTNERMFCGWFTYEKRV